MNRQADKHPGRRAPEGGNLPDPEALLTSQLEFIKRIVWHVARRRMLPREDLEDFEAQVHLKLLDNDYAVLRRFEGRSSLATYLVAVIQRVFLDFQMKKWGKWRPSSAAANQGPLAIELERLVHRDGRTFEEACAILESAPLAEPLDRGRLAEMFEGLPVRPSHRTTTLETIAELPAPYGQPDSLLQDQERQETARKVQALLDEALGTLSPEGRLLVRLTFFEQLTIAAVAARLGLKRRPLYRARERCLAQIRRHLESHGLDAQTVANLLAHPAGSIESKRWRGRGRETRAPGPSHAARAGPTQDRGAS